MIAMVRADLKNGFRMLPDQILQDRTSDIDIGNGWDVAWHEEPSLKHQPDHRAERHGEWRRDQHSATRRGGALPRLPLRFGPTDHSHRIMTMTFSRYLLMAMIALSAFFVYLLCQDPVPNQPIEQSTVYRLMMLLTGGAGLFVALTLYHQARSQEVATEKALELSTIKIIKDLWITPNLRLAHDYENLGTIPAEMYPDLSIKSSQDMHQVAFAISIFQIFEDYKTIYTHDKTGVNIWLGNFLNWAQSDTLQQLWPRLKINYQPSTIRMTEALFAAANEIKALRAQQGQVSYQDYQAVIDRLAIDFTQRIAHSDATTV